MQYPPGLIWVAEAAGVDSTIVSSAVAAFAEAKRMGMRAASQCAAIRRDISWDAVYDALMRNRSLMQSEERGASVGHIVSEPIKTVQQFTSCLQETEGGLTDILDLVREGLMPNDEQVEDVMTSLSELKGLHGEIRRLAAEITIEYESDCLSAFDCIEAIERAEKEKEFALQARIDSLTSVLTPFLAIRARGEDFEKAIIPFREEASKALEYLRALNDYVLLDDFERECEPKRIFINAVNTEDFDTEDGEAILDALGPFYPWKVQQGLMLHRYYLEEARSVLTDEVNETGFLENRPESPDTAQSKAVGVSVDSDLNASQAQSRTTDGQEDLEELIVPINQAKVPKRISASSFKRELLHSSFVSVRSIIPVVRVCSCVEAKQVSFLSSYMAQGLYTSTEIEKGISYLLRKGVVSQFELGERSTVYCISDYGKSLLEKETIRRLKNGQQEFWHISIGDVSYSFDAGLPKAFAERRLQQIDNLIDCIAANDDPSNQGIIGTISGISFTGDVLSVRTTVDGEQRDVVIVGEGEEAPEDAEYVLRVSSDGPESEADGSADDSVHFTTTNEVDESTTFKETDEGSVRLISGLTNEADGHQYEKEYEEPRTTVDLDDPVEETPTAMDSLDYEDDKGDISDDVIREEVVETNHGVEPSVQKPSAVIEEMLDTGSVSTASCPSDADFVRMAAYMIDYPNESSGLTTFGAVACALALLESAATKDGYTLSVARLRQMRLAVGIKAKGIEYSGNSLASTFTEFNLDDEPLILAAYCRALFDPKNQYDYELWNTCEPLLSQFSESFPSYRELRPLLAKLLEIHQVSPTSGFSERVVDMLGDRANQSKMLDDMKSRAERLMEKPTFKAMIHGMPDFNESCFGKSSDLYYCMTVIRDDSRDDIDIVRVTLSEFCDSVGQIDESVIGSTIDQNWRAAVANKNTKGIRRLEVLARKQAIEAYTARLSLMEDWVSYVDGNVDDQSTMKLGKIRRELINILGECATTLETEKRNRPGKAIVLLMLNALCARLVDGESQPDIFSEFLLTGYISLKDDGTPDIDPEHNSVRYFEPWRRVLLHWISDKPTMEATAQAICSDDSICSDNLRQLSHIERILGHKATVESHDTLLSRAQTIAEHDGNKFSERLEIAYAFGEIDEPQRELLQGLLAASKDSLFEIEEFGLWHQLIAALERQMSDISARQGRQLASRLTRCEKALGNNEECDLLLQARFQLNEARNFAVVEEYLNRFEAGERKLPEGYSEEDSFAEFISEDVYTPLLEACQRGKSQQFTRFAKSYVQGHYPADWTARHKESTEWLIKSWPCSGKKKPDPTTITQLFRHLGFNVRGGRMSNAGGEHFLLEMRRERRNQSDYPHPIAMFGTQARSPLDVIVLHGNRSAREIVNQVTKARVNGMSVVIVDSGLTLQTRRQVAEIFHTSKSKISPFVLIDQVLALHLALHQETERLPILLKCTLPFTYYQPFIRDGGATADEMFSGRESELRTIIDPQGATVVYGGRQLGKTALLERAEGLRHDPENGRLAVLVNIQQCMSEESFVKEIVRTIRRKTNLVLQECDDIDSLCEQIRKALDGNDTNSLLLLIDEADNFLNSISSDKYMPIKPMVDLKRERSSEFKFVLAGLHNVVRYKNATADNGIFGQLGQPLCVKPLKPADALRLMSRPLGYLGFDVKRYPHIETILTNTNYYPGILQFFGYELVDTMTKQYGQYYQASRGNPPYELTQEQLGSIMNSRGLNDSIREKFLLSLRLDPRYLALARCVALITYENEGDTASELEGISVAETLTCAKEWDVESLLDETVGSTEILMDEMVDMGILAKGEGNGYRLRMHRFLSIIGSADSILDAFVSEEEV